MKKELVRISKAPETYKVIYLKDRMFKLKKFKSLLDAIDFSKNTLHATHEQVVLSINL